MDPYLLVVVSGRSEWGVEVAQVGVGQVVIFFLLLGVDGRNLGLAKGLSAASLASPHRHRIRSVRRLHIDVLPSLRNFLPGKGRYRLRFGGLFELLMGLCNFVS
jgi:hypothetical protein